MGLPNALRGGRRFEECRRGPRDAGGATVEGTVLGPAADAAHARGAQLEFRYLPPLRDGADGVLLVVAEVTDRSRGYACSLAFPAMGATPTW